MRSSRWCCPARLLSINVIQEGKEAGQGVGYMDDGTMVVVENGKEYIGEYMDVTRHQGAADRRRAHDLWPCGRRGTASQRRAQSRVQERRLVHGDSFIPWFIIRATQIEEQGDTMLRIYNTLTRKKEDFETLEPNVVQACTSAV